MGKHYIRPSELPRYANALPHIQQTRILKVVVWLLERLAYVVGYPIYVALPTEVAELKEFPEALRAMRIVKRLQQAGYISHSEYIVYDYPDEPPAWILFHTLQHTKKRLGSAGKAAHTSSIEYLQWPALGEAIERHCMQHPHHTQNELIISSYTDLKSKKVDIFSITSFSTSERVENRVLCPLAYDIFSEFCWAPVTNAVTGKIVYAPWQWFSFSHLHTVLSATTTHNEPLLSPPISTGAAAGQTINHAVLAGLLEVIERDAFMIYWLQQLPARRIDLDSIEDDRVRALRDLARDYRIELEVLYLETDAPVHTVCSVVIDRTMVGPAVYVEAKSGFDLVEIIHDLLQDQLAQRGALYRLWERNEDLQDVPAADLNHVAGILYWQKPERLNDIAPFISGPVCAVTELPKYDVGITVDEKLAHLYNWCRESNYPVYYRELISPKMKKMAEGVSAVMVRVPDLQPLYVEEQYKATGGTRLQSIPRSLGYTPRYDLESGYCPIPNPFT